jgi:hypothetical protein
MGETDQDKKEYLAQMKLTEAVYDLRGADWSNDDILAKVEDILEELQEVEEEVEEEE